MFSTLFKIIGLIILIIGILIFLFFIFIFAVYLFTPSRDSFGCINECIGCNGDEETIWDRKSESYVKACDKCPYNPELYEWDPELMMDVKKKKHK